MISVIITFSAGFERVFLHSEDYNRTKNNFHLILRFYTSDSFQIADGGQVGFGLRGLERVQWQWHQRAGSELVFEIKTSIN